ncbi:MAG: tellurite resistance TerB family protein, partial [Granulosicoccus sp.]|nr:tellurite resistance TerB family protein [Granulosicoccus sp.]
MSLVKTLGKLAVGALVAKGVGKVIQNKMGGAAGGSGTATRMNEGGLGGLLGGNSSGGMGELLGGGNAGSSGGLPGGLGGLLESLGGAGGAGGAGAGGLGDLLNSVLKGGEPAQEPTQEHNQQAEVMLKAMLNAAKCDGELDQAEKEKIMKNLDDVSAEDMEFIRRELAAPVDVASFVRDVPRGMEQQVYLMSLMAIDLDSRAEADYLDSLAKGMGISEQASNQI